VIVQTSTGGAVGMTADERAQPLECVPPPEMASLNSGSLNFGEDVFLNPFPLVREFARRMRAKGIAYELECYDVGHVEACLRLAEEGAIELPAHFDFVMGVRGGIQATEDNLVFMVSKLPRGCTFNVAGIGRHQHLPEQGRAREGELRAGRQGRRDRAGSPPADRDAGAGARDPANPEEAAMKYRTARSRRRRQSSPI